MIKIYGNNLTDKGGKMIIIELIISFQLMNKIFCYLCRFAISIEKQKFFFSKNNLSCNLRDSSVTDKNVFTKQCSNESSTGSLIPTLNKTNAIQTCK